jgi:hypothetical protein
LYMNEDGVVKDFGRGEEECERWMV